MLISELMESLDEILSEHYDMEVLITSEEANCLLEIKSTEMVKPENNDYESVVLIRG